MSKENRSERIFRQLAERGMQNEGFLYGKNSIFITFSTIIFRNS